MSFGDAPCGTLERYVNLLQSGTKREKQSAIEDLKKIVDQADVDLLIDVRCKLQNQLIICLQDRSESVREGALAVGRSLIERLPVNGAYVAPLLPALYARVCHRDDRECSEELLAQMAEFAILLVDKYDKHLSPYFVEIVEMACRLLAEPSPQVKTVSSNLVVSLAKNLPRDTFENTAKLWPPLVANITHQRWRVRVATVEALEFLMLKGDNKFVGDVTPALNKKMLDPMHQVRLAIVKLAGSWLVKLPDRYSFFSHLIPILLSGLADENDDVVELATTLWKEAGDQYLRENDTEYKDRINFEEILENYPPGVARPSLGCRILIEREATKFLLALANELTDWSEIVRVKSSILLTQVILHMEKSVTMSLRKVIPQVCKAARDENRQVAGNAKLAAEYVGRFVPADVYCRLVVDPIGDAGEGELLVAAALVRGTRRADLLDNIDSIASLMEPPAGGRRQMALLELIESAMQVGRSDVLQVGETVWAALVSIVGLAEGETIRDEAARLLDEFVTLGGGDRREMSSRYCDKLLDKLDAAVWTAHCREQHVLAAVVDVAAEIVTAHLDRILRIFQNASRPDVDPEVLLKVFMTTNALLGKADVALTTDTALAQFVGSTLSVILPGHLRWAAGRKAEALRTAACTCLFMCLSKMAALRKTQNPAEKTQNTSDTQNPAEAQISPQIFPNANIPAEKSGIRITDISQLPASGNVSKSDEEISKFEIFDINSLLEQLLPILMSLVQDPSPKTRLLALKSVEILSTSDASHDGSTFSTIVAQIVKRLDDADNSVRQAAVDVLAKCYDRHLKLTPIESVNRTMAGFIFSTLLIHLDDKDTNLKLSILNCLRILAKIDPHALRGKVQPDNFIDKNVCRELIDFLEEQMKSVVIS